MRKTKIFVIGLLILTVKLSAQVKEKMPKFFGETFKLENVNRLLLTVQYNTDLFSGKFSFSDYYGNLVFFNYETNTQKRLFEKDTHIKPFRERSYYYRNKTPELLPKNISKEYIFLFVYNTDFDKNKKITNTDPATLYVCDLKGNNLKAITPKDENAVSFELFDDKGFILVKMQRDLNKDLDFTYKDKDFYFLKIDLKSFEVETSIELKANK